MGNKVVVVGSLHMDVVVHAARYPQPGETIAGDDWRVVFGGKGGNQALQAAFQGASVAMVSRIGPDDFGAGLMKTMVDAGIDTSCVRLDEAGRSGMGIALIDHRGIPLGVTVSGVNQKIDAVDIEAAEAVIADASCLLLQQEIPPAANIAAARAARRLGARVILNAAPAYPLPPELGEQVDILVANEVEASMISGLQVTDVHTAFQALQQIRSDIPVVIVTLGEQGLVVREPGQPLRHHPAFRVTAVDTLGAGDSFIGALAAKLAGGDSLDNALRYASATGALAVTDFGVTGDHIHPDRVLAFLDSYRAQKSAVTKDD